jgi:uncharacterized protein (TIGR02001 family)
MNKILNKHLLAALLATPLVLSASFAQAEDAVEAAPAAEATPAAEAAPAEPTPDWTLSYNLGLYSNYIFRGISLSDDGPAVQGGIDLAHSSGFFLGTWFSNIEKNVSAGNHYEVDLYGGYGYTFENGFGITVSGLYYAYPEGKQQGISQTFNTFEAALALSYAGFTYTYSNALTDYYGAPDSKNAEYHELKYGTALPIGGLNFSTKVGYQDTAGLGLNEGDFAIGLNRNFSLPSAGKPIEGFNAGATYSQLFDMEAGGDKNKTITFYVKRTW